MQALEPAPVEPRKLVRLMAVQAVLTPDEAAELRSQILAMDATILRALLDELSAVPMPRALQLARKLLNE